MRKVISILMVLAMTLVLAVSSEAVLKRRKLPGYYVDQVNSLFVQHHWTKGKSLLDEGLEQYPNDPNLHYLAGRYWVRSKNYDQARYHLVKACHINYDHTDAKQLLVNVEEATGNYSSAICYVNELLEVNPYWKGLWLRKINLYKKEGNLEMANQFLRRLNKIYPHDASISADVYEVLQRTYQEARIRGDLNASEDALSEMVLLNPKDVESQVAYANLLIRKGRLDDALDQLIYATNENPGNVELIRRAAGIMMDNGRHVAALSLVRSQLALHPSPELQRLYNSLMEDAARMEKDADAYQLYAKVYSTSKTPESLEYMLTQSIRRGYYDDALTYIGEMRAKTGPSPRLSMLEHDVYLHKGDQKAARRTLEAAAKQFPGEYDINLAYCELMLDDAARLMSDGQYAAAIAPLEYVDAKAEEAEQRQNAVRRLSLCYRETGMFDKAEVKLNERLLYDPAYQVTADRADLLEKQGNKDGALSLLEKAYRGADDSFTRIFYKNLYEEKAMPVVREANEEGASPRVVAMCDVLLEMNPANYWALRYAANASDDPEPYIKGGVLYYPNDPWFRRKEAVLLSESGRNEEAMASLKEMLAMYPADPDLASAYAGMSVRQADTLMTAKRWDEAQAVLDTALVFSPNDAQLRYARGQVYAHHHQWDSAFYYQRTYRPAFLEEKAYRAQMLALQNKMFKNSVFAGYDQMRFGDDYKIVGYAQLGYNRKFKRSDLTAQVNYTGRDAVLEIEDDQATEESPGGRGLQFQAQYHYELTDNWSLMGQAGVGYAYFPKLTLDASVTRHFSAFDAEAGIQYRYLQDDSSMEALWLGASMTPGQFFLGGKVTAGLLSNRFFFNSTLRGKYFPFDGGKTCVEAQMGVGSAPELDFLNFYYSPRAYNHLNSFVALGGSWLAAPGLMFSLSGTWNTWYSESESRVSYRNIFIAHVQVTVYF